jgi:hypothetical protein
MVSYVYSINIKRKLYELSRIPKVKTYPHKKITFFLFGVRAEQSRRQYYGLQTLKATKP